MPKTTAGENVCKIEMTVCERQNGYSCPEQRCRKCFFFLFLDSVGVGPAFLAPDTDVPLFVVPGLDQDHGADKAHHIHDREAKQRRVQLAQVAVRKRRDLFFTSRELCWYRAGTRARQENTRLVAETVPTALSVAR